MTSTFSNVNVFSSGTLEALSAHTIAFLTQLFCFLELKDPDGQTMNWIALDFIRLDWVTGRLDLYRLLSF